MADQKTVEGQLRLYGFIARAVEKLHSVGSENFTRGALQSRLENLENNWVKFQQADGDLYSAGLNESLGEHSYFKDDVFSLCEDAFLKAKAEFLDKLGELEPTPSSRRNVTAGGSESGLSSNGGRHRALPKIVLPKFSGKYTEWKSFCDLFSSMVGDNDEITPVEKLHYLKTNVTGDAARLIANIPTQDVNFQTAWDRLKSKFDNKRALVNAQLDVLFGIKPLTRKSSQDLENLRTTVAGVLESLESIGGQVDSLLDFLLVYFVCRRLDADSHEAWELRLGGSRDPPKYEDLDKFLEGRARALETVDARPTPTNKPSTIPPKPTPRPSSFKVHTATARVESCALCGANHFLPTCAQFLAMRVDQRRGVVLSKKLCFNCLGRHQVKTCRSNGRCRECRDRHHTLLHEGRPSESGQTPAGSSASENRTPSPAAPVASAGKASSQPSQRTSASSATAGTFHTLSRDSPAGFQPVLLATAVVRVSSPEGRSVAARALVDQGSELSFVCESVVQALGIPRFSSSILLTGVGAQKTASTRGRVKLNIQNRLDSSLEFSLEAHILPKLTGSIPSQEFDARPWSHLSNLELADPCFAVPGRVDLLLGANIYGHLLREEIRRGDSGSPVAQSTALGWIVSGPASSSVCVPEGPPRVFHCARDQELDDLVKQFWAQETVASPKSGRLSRDDAACEEHFRTTYTRNPDGRYVVRLPFKNGPILGGNSRQIAAQMYAKISRRFQRDPTFHQLYSDFMNEYLRLGHMEPSSWPPSTEEFFLPHHGVLSGTSSTTKLRVVFNGSQVTSDGNSLNDSLHSGPKLQSELLDVLLRWRRHAYVYTADVEKMFRQIVLHPADRRFQQILWSGDESKPPPALQLCTVTYGLTCAPYHATRVLRQLAEDERERFPLAADVIKENTYVDDVLGGADLIESTQEQVEQVDAMFRAGGFRLHKWSSNVPLILHSVDPDRRVKVHKDFDENPVLRALGLSWNPVLDTFVFQFRGNLEDSLRPTKRSVLSFIARLFDPLGWLAPVIVKAKIFLQKLWNSNLDWDEVLPEHLATCWTEYVNEVQSGGQFSIPRWFGTAAHSQIELHGFADASTDALGASVYVRVGSDCHEARTSLMLAKTKVAPMKRVTIARLELSAAVLLSQLTLRIQTCLKYDQVPVHLWTDSSVALAWIRGDPARWKDFVGNRVALIHELVPKAQWHHVPGTENPADMASRGLFPRELDGNQLWWEGPGWLRGQPESWPMGFPEVPDGVELERRTTATALTVRALETWSLLSKYSSLDRLLRVTARIRRAVEILRGRAKKTDFSLELTPQELDTAMKFWVGEIQRLHYPVERKALSEKKDVPKSSPLYRLHPFVDSEGLLRLGGRLQLSSLEYGSKHPLILPKESELSSLLIREIHRRTLHGGVQLTLATLRQDYWIVGGRAPVRSWILRCVKCARMRGETARQMMGQLPRLRTAPSRPFQHSGVDYAGPFTLKVWSGRSAKTYKAYLIVFICFATSACHLELSTDYSTEGFLAAYRRFTGRRGACSTMRSDCGTNLVGADAELKRLFSAASRDFAELRNLLASDGTEWQFNPPSAPHFGGKWEAAVKSAKFHIKRVVGEAVLTYEEFSTVLAQIEGLLNSRPLCPLSDDPMDATALTPGHFLTGGPINLFPEPSLGHLVQSRLSRWQRVRQLVEHFWTRWSKEYLQRLQGISKWHTASDAVKVNSVVLIVDERVPPGKWPLARVISLHPGEDGCVRVVTVRSAAGSEMKRPLVKLCVLPVETPEEGYAVSSGSN